MNLGLKIIPQKWQICGMCHCSSECPNCCKTCESDKCGNSGPQGCGLEQPAEWQADRLNAWIHIVELPDFKHLKKYLIKKSKRYET